MPTDFYINDDTDVILEEVDAFLIKFWEGLTAAFSMKHLLLPYGLENTFCCV
ncbi:MAG: hypothetical protein ACLUE2_22845 [Bacteroides cellulosilyticus]